MQKDVLLNLLAEGFGVKPKGGVFAVPEEDRATVLVSVDSGVLSVEQVREVVIRDGYLVARTADQLETYLVELDRVVGLKIRHGTKGGAGFVS